MDELLVVVRDAKKTITVVGSGLSQGKQSLKTNGIRLSLEHFNNILDVSTTYVIVEAGITWRKLQKFLDTKHLSVKCMQSYNDFTVGGSLSVNAHGRDCHAIVDTILFFNLMLSTGAIMRCSRTENSDVFGAAIGGYGGFGILMHVALQIIPNTNMILLNKEIKTIDLIQEWPRSTKEILVNANIVLPDFEKSIIKLYYPTSRPMPNQGLQEAKSSFLYKVSDVMMKALPDWTKTMRSYLEDQLENPGSSRNYEMSASVKQLEPFTRHHSFCILQEYFIPIVNYKHFISRLENTVQRYKMNLVNVSIRYVCADKTSLWTYAPVDSFAFVLYISVWRASLNIVQSFTNSLCKQALILGGKYYLPYQPFVSKVLFRLCYPVDRYLKLKKTIDPTNKFTNDMLEYYLY
jgi:FAD/FMN-containing dehydrogenase